MCGFLINDFFDKSHDIKAGKIRVVHELSKGVFISVIFTAILIIILFLLYLNNIFYTIIYCISFLLGTLYSTPVIRFKEKGFIGIIINALTEKMLPVLAIFTFFYHIGIDTLIFLITSFLLQTIEIMTHQIYDYDADLEVGVRTFAIDVGKEKALKIFKYIILPISLFFLILLCSIIIIKVPFAIFVVLPVLVIYLALSLFLSRGRLKMEEKILPLYMSPLYLLVNNAFPILLAFILVSTSFLNTPLLIVALISQYYLFKQVFKLIKEKAIPRTEIADT
jgi:4-hydroxybenzoate polyprenyltransferase